MILYSEGSSVMKLTVFSLNFDNVFRVCKVCKVDLRCVECYAYIFLFPYKDLILL